jgi:hypothetical protein
MAGYEIIILGKEVKRKRGGFASDASTLIEETGAAIGCNVG